MENTSIGEGDSGTGEPLTPQELLVLRALKKHGNVPGVAEELSISLHTAERHIKNLRIKSGKHHPAQIIAWGYDNGLPIKDDEDR